MDAFKRYLQERKEALDKHTPSKGVEEALFARLGKVGTEGRSEKRDWAEKGDGDVRRKWIGGRVMWMRMVVAASVAGVLLVGVIFWRMGRKEMGYTEAGVAGRQMVKEGPKAAVKKQDSVEKDLRKEAGMSERKEEVARIGKGRRTGVKRQGALPGDHTYERALAAKYKKIRQTPIYAEDSAYFSSFLQQLRDLDSYEAIVKQYLIKQGTAQIEVVYQKKIALLNELQYEINRMNGTVMRSGPGHTPDAYFLNF